MRKLIKYGCGILGIIIFIFCITGEIEGVGRFACIVFGTLFSILGMTLSGRKGG